VEKFDVVSPDHDWNPTILEMRIILVILYPSGLGSNVSLTQKRGHFPENARENILGVQEWEENHFSSVSHGRISIMNLENIPA
jgi:hypothetical protein